MESLPHKQNTTQGHFPGACAPIPLGSAGAPAAMGLYLLHFDPPYLHAGHYLGFSGEISARLEQHASCGAKASPLVRAALDAGAAVSLVRVWLGGSRVLERRLKRGGGLSRHCPICRARGRYHS